MTTANIRVGIIGCGNISGIYFKNLSEFEGVEVVACADLDVERAKAKAAEHGVPRGCSVDELLADPEVDLVLNLTIPAAHAEVCLRALEQGKHVYVEKPLAVKREDGERIVALAAEKGLRVGSAPDTFLGAGIQTCLQLIQDGAIGTPVSAVAFMLARGHEYWHPSPEFYYQVGGGPMFDMGPYYLTALVSLLGPIRDIAGMTRITHPERTIHSEPKRGQVMKVEVPTHIAGTLRFESGAIGTMIMSFDVASGHNLPRIEIYGTEGTLSVPDPNTFGGPVRLMKAGEKEWQDIEVTLPYGGNSRGVGVVDMANAIRSGSEFRANGALALHVLEAMHGFHDSSDEGVVYRMKSRCEAPSPLHASKAAR
ncbi:Gfo/Idh/MocA family oxidoreductase [Paenibacillus sp. TRM 82003]|nr:Gfo/Idh/MocA family oxidoreductase [Paenibacillus sp. TRM 82003]